MSCVVWGMLIDVASVALHALEANISTYPYTSHLIFIYSCQFIFFQRDWMIDVASVKFLSLEANISTFSRIRLIDVASVAWHALEANISTFPNTSHLIFIYSCQFIFFPKRLNDWCRLGRLLVIRSQHLIHLLGIHIHIFMHLVIILVLFQFNMYIVFVYLWWINTSNQYIEKVFIS